MPDDPKIRDRLVQREDDDEESVRNRLDIFDENTRPVIDHYADHAAFVAIDGEQTPDEVWDDIHAAIDERV
jgi:adenylate kinase